MTINAPENIVEISEINLYHLIDLEEVLNRFLGSNTFVLGGLNTDIGVSRYTWDQQVAELLESFGLVDLLQHFRQRLHYCKLQTWWQVHQGRAIWSWCDYVLGLDFPMFKTIGIQYPRNFVSNHFPLQEELLVWPNRCHRRYLQGRRAFPLAIPGTGAYSVLKWWYQHASGQQPHGFWMSMASIHAELDAMDKEWPPDISQEAC